MGQVCRKHEEFYEETCRWCVEPAKAVGAPLVGLEMAVPLPAQMAAAQQNAASGSIMGGLGAWLPPANPYRAFVPHDYDGATYVCRRCGHHFTGPGQPSCPVTP